MSRIILLPIYHLVYEAPSNQSILFALNTSVQNEEGFMFQPKVFIGSNFLKLNILHLHRIFCQFPAILWFLPRYAMPYLRNKLQATKHYINSIVGIYSAVHIIVNLVSNHDIAWLY